MKVKELIEKLQEEDQEAYVYSYSGPVYRIEGKPGYYDGATEHLIHDEKAKPYYSIVGYKQDRSKPKVYLCCMSLKDCLYDCSTIEDVDKFLVEGDPRFLEEALSLKEEVKNDFRLWGFK